MDPFAPGAGDVQARPLHVRASWIPGRRAVRVGTVGGILSAPLAAHASIVFWPLPILGTEPPWLTAGLAAVAALGIWSLTGFLCGQLTGDRGQSVISGAVAGMVSCWAGPSLSTAMGACGPLIDRVLQPDLGDGWLEWTLVAGLLLAGVGLVVAPIVGSILGGLMGGIGALGVRAEPAEADPLHDLAGLAAAMGSTAITTVLMLVAVGISMSSLAEATFTASVNGQLDLALPIALTLMVLGALVILFAYAAGLTWLWGRAGLGAVSRYLGDTGTRFVRGLTWLWVVVLVLLTWSAFGLGSTLHTFCTLGMATIILAAVLGLRTSEDPPEGPLEPQQALLDLGLFTTVLSTPVVASMTAYGIAAAFTVVQLIVPLTDGSPAQLVLEDRSALYLLSALPLSTAVGTWPMALAGALRMRFGTH